MATPRNNREADFLGIVRATRALRFLFSLPDLTACAVAFDFSPLYSLLSSDLCLLYEFKTIPPQLVPTTLPNGDVCLRDKDRKELVFDVIAVVLACGLQAPCGIPS